jgi:hypothetical protein
MSELFPTFDLPAKATSGTSSGGGSESSFVAACVKVHAGLPPFRPRRRRSSGDMSW